MTADYRALDLFCGLGGFSAAFADSDRWQVTTVDINAEFEPDIRADVMDLRPSRFGNRFDVILASPPCNQFSPAQNLNGDHEPNADTITLVYHALGLICGLKPYYWYLENPRGRLRSLIGQPSETVTYCQYGQQRMKPTDLWGEHPTTFVGQSCSYSDGCHRSTRQGSNVARHELGFETAADRAKVPYDLSDAIREACERALDGHANEQQTLADVGVIER